MFLSPEMLLEEKLLHKPQPPRINSHGWYEESLTLLSFTGIRLNTANPSLSTGKDFLMHSLGKD